MLQRQIENIAYECLKEAEEQIEEIQMKIDKNINEKTEILEKITEIPLQND